MWGIVSEDRLLVRIVKNTGKSAIVSSRRCTRVFLHIGLKFTSNKEDFLVDMCILLNLILFRPCGRGSKLVNKQNNKSSENICWAVLHPDVLVWLVIDSNNFCYVSLGHYTISEQYRLHMWGQSEAFSTFTIPVEFSPSLVLWYLTFFRIPSSSDFIQPINYTFWMDG